MDSKTKEWIGMGVGSALLLAVGSSVLYTSDRLVEMPLEEHRKTLGDVITIESNDSYYLPGGFRTLSYQLVEHDVVRLSACSRRSPENCQSYSFKAHEPLFRLLNLDLSASKNIDFCLLNKGIAPQKLVAEVISCPPAQPLKSPL